MADNQNTEVKLILTLEAKDGKQFNATIKTSAEEAKKFAAAADKISIKNTKIARSSASTRTAINSLNNAVGQTPKNLSDVAEAVGPVLKDFGDLAKKTGGVKAALSSMATGLAGPAGIAVALTGVISLLTSYAIASDSASEETRDLTIESAELTIKIRQLSAEYRDLAEGNKLYRKELLKTGIAEKEADRKRLQLKLKAGGTQRVIKGQAAFVPLSDIQKEKIEKNIADLSKEIDKFYKSIDDGNPVVKENIALLNDLSTAALTAGEKGITSFLRKNSLSEKQLGNLISQLKEFKETGFAVFGGKAKGLDPKALEISGQLNPVKEEIGKAIAELDKFYEKLSGKGKEKIIFAPGSLGYLKQQLKQLKSEYEKTTDPDKRIELNGKIILTKYEIKRLQGVLKDSAKVEIKVAGFDTSELSPAQQKLFNTLKKNFENKGFKFNAARQAFAINFVSNFTEPTASETIKPITSQKKAAADPGAKYVTKSLGELEEQSIQVNDVAMTLSDTMVSGFIDTKMAIGEVVQEMGLLITKMLIMASIQKVVSTREE